MEKQTEFFSQLHTLSINEIKRELLNRSQGSPATYNEIVNDYRDFIHRVIGIDKDISIEETKEDFADSKTKELKPLSAKKISRYEFEFEPPYRLVLDFITIKSNNVVRVSQLKVSCIWEKERERISVFVFGAFRFREACKLILSELLKPKTVEPEAAQPEKIKSDRYKDQNWFKIGLLFATGEIYALLNKHQNNATHLAKELGNEKGFRPFISDSVSVRGSVDRPTNIFSRPNKIRSLYNYCIENKKDMCDEFLENYNKIELK